MAIVLAGKGSVPSRRDLFSGKQAKECYGVLCLDLQCILHCHGLMVTTGDILNSDRLQTEGFKVEGIKNVTPPEMRQPKRPSQSQREKIKPRSCLLERDWRLDLGEPDTGHASPVVRQVHPAPYMSW